MVIMLSLSKTIRLSRVIFFDGVCNLCNWSVRFIIKHDKRCIYSFASLQSEFAKDQLIQVNGQDIKYDSIVYLEDNLILAQSDAILNIVLGFGGVWKLVGIFKIIPKQLRDGIYKIIANNRYRWFGKRKECMVPSKELASRFLGR